jgi:hypothetical protein
VEHNARQKWTGYVDLARKHLGAAGDEENVVEAKTFAKSTHRDTTSMAEGSAAALNRSGQIQPCRDTIAPGDDAVAEPVADDSS